MKTAIIGWGSLIRCPGGLTLASKWHPDGPRLPLEFSRLSSGMRLTLVLDETAAPQPTYWALSGCVDSVEAREQLRNRESTPKPDRIHMIDEYGDFHGHKGIQPVAAAIREWITGNDGVDAAIWTGLGPKWPGEQRKRFGEWSTGAAIAYLSSLANERIHHDAELYFRHAPPDVYTKLRRLVEKELGWNRVALPCELLENS